MPAAFVALSMAAHLAVLVQMVAGVGPGPVSLDRPHALYARLLTVPPALSAASEGGGLRRPQAYAGTAVPAATDAPTAAPEKTPATPAVEPESPGADSPAAAFEPQYLPRSALSIGPRPLDLVMVPYPSFDGDKGHYAAELSLFIDADGQVQRLEIAPGALPAALERAVRVTFLGTRFEPGQREGKPVASELRIEVNFGSGRSSS